MNGKVLIFSAPSGSGKTTIVRHLIEVFPQLEFSISATTREPRGSERDGVDYYFLSEKKFRAAIDAGEFVEWEEVYPGQFYGTLKSEVSRIWTRGNVIIFDVDVQGGLALKNYFGEQALCIFIQPPSVSELEKRLVNRSTDSRESIQSRIQKAEQEMSFSDQFDRVLINDNLSQAFADAEEAVGEFINS